MDKPSNSRQSVNVDYRGLAATGIETIIEIRLLGVSLSSPHGPKAPLNLNAHVRIRVVRAQDGHDILLDYLSYAGTPRRFVEWGSDDARPYRDELQRCVDNLAHEIVTQIFVRQELTKENVVELRGNGIVR